MLDVIADQLRRSHRIALIAHVSPDGDTMGSSVALYFALQTMGKAPTVVCAQKLPEAYRFMPGYELATAPESLAGEVFDYALAVDVADEKRLGTASALFHAAKATGCIDHHVTNPGFAQVNAIHPEMSATSELAFALIQKLGAPMTRDMADCLFLALCTDTGRFSYSNTTENALRVAAQLVHYGAQIERIVRYVYRSRRPEKVALIGRALSSLKLYEEGRISVIKLTEQDFIDCNANDGDAEDIVDYGIEMAGVQAALFVRETPSGIKASFRSWPGVDVSAVAQRFGGGGHVQAAGCSFAPPLSTAIERSVAALSCALMPPGTCDL